MEHIHCKPYILFVHIKIFKRERQTRVVRLKRLFLYDDDDDDDDRDGRTSFGQSVVEEA